ncbi:hypothetical protein [Cardinium endosymbiont of Philonthus spinipes]|uniref:hypothetical protein n=1 Tax=Cardinium endosymbiont of Philonthus spinipes TaxID=3077941 RepID=UPI00313B2556
MQSVVAAYATYDLVHNQAGDIRPSAKPVSNGNFGVEAYLCSSNTSSILRCSTALLLKIADHK